MIIKKSPILPPQKNQNENVDSNGTSKSIFEKGAFPMTTEQTYTREQAMERLGITSIKDFRRFERKNAATFINVNLGVHRDTQPLYDKSAIDNFAKTRAKLLRSES